MSSCDEVRFLAFTEEGRENVEAVYKIAKDLKRTWVTPEEAASVSELKEEVVYVVDPIEGDEVGTVIDHLVELKYPVIGPQCGLTVLKHGIHLQRDLKYPVYTLTMLGTTVCFSNIMTEERVKLVRLVELMGGEVSRPLHCGVTHLIVGEVGSVKYFTANSYKINIMVKDWIYHLWKHGVSRYINAKDGKWEEFQCPIFLGCFVCVTGFGTSEKTRIQKLVTKFGGEYSGAMKLNYTTHLVVSKPEGQKFAMANKFGVKVVNVNWVYDSVEKEACQDNNRYPVKVEGYTKSNIQSTPESHAIKSTIGSMDMSCIDPSMVNETVASTMNDTSRMSSIGIPSSSFLPPPARLPVSGPATNSKSELLSFPMDQDYGDVLDGIHVFLVGFTPNEEEKMRQLLSLAGAIKYSQLTTSVTHVITGSNNRVSNNVKTEISSSGIQNPELCAVNHTWVLDCLCKHELVPEKEHWAKDLFPPPPTHEMDVDHTHMDSTTDANDTTAYDQKSTVKKIRAKPSRADLDGSMLGFLAPAAVDDDEMLSQYMNPQTDDTTMGQNPEIGDTIAEGSSFVRRNMRSIDNDASCTPDVDETRDQNETAMDTSTMRTDATAIECLSGKTFLILGFDNEETQQVISEIECNGGCVLAVNSKTIADYAVVPLTGWPVDKTVQDVVTNFWLELCITESRLVPPDEHVMCTPFSVPPDSRPLEGCVSCLSKYRSTERTFLCRLIEELGGVCQEIVARRDISENKQTTHLILPEPGGDKYTGCKNWGIFTITEEWVYECARRGQRAREADFSVDKPRKPTVRSEPMMQPPRNSSTSSAEVIVKVDALSKGSKIKQQIYKNWNTEFPPMPRPPSVVDKIRKRLEAKADAERKMKEEAIKNKETPLRVRYKRLNLETPSKFMTKGAPPVNVSFDLTEVFELLKTPKEQQKRIQQEFRNHPETPLSEFLTRCLDEGVANIPKHLIQNLENKLYESLTDHGCDTDMDQTKEDNTSTDTGTTSNIFQSLVISLAKKLHDQFAELSKMVVQHGGEFRWTYDNACTHLLFQGKLNDKNKEFCTAKKEDKFIVSPHWVNACIQTDSRIDENLFPHVYDPNKSIQMVTSSPPKTRRRTLRNTNDSINGAASRLRSGTSSTSTESEDDSIVKQVSKTKNEPDIEVEDSQEAREKLRKKLEHIMSATKVVRDTHMHRLSCSRTNTPSPSTAAAQRRTVAGAPIALKDVDLDKTELSQDVQVSWDDPTGREELERLMRENQTVGDESSFKIPENITCLKEANNVDDDFTGNASPEVHGRKNLNIKVEHDGQGHGIKDNQENEDSDTPDFVRDGITPHFIVSSVSAQEKTEYAETVEELGGAFLESFLDPKSTHLLVSKAARSEKFLSALASGKWVIHTRYVTACKEAGKFVKENQYEYGNPLNPDTEKLKLKPNDVQSLLPMAAHRWRKEVQKRTKERGSREGAFSGWKVLLHVNERQLKGFERLLQCGSAEVVASQLPYNGKPGDITHAFIDLDKGKQLDETYIEELVSRTGIHVCVPAYIGEFLIKNPPPEPHTHYLPQVAKILQKSDQENDGRETKRRKLDGN